MEYKEINEVYPHLVVKDGVVESKRGDLTFGWLVTLPAAFRNNSESYDAMLHSFSAAISLLPDYTIVHKQDVFAYNTYEKESSCDFLQDCYERHFEGRRYLDHSCRIFLTFAAKNNIGKGSGLRGLELAVVPTQNEVEKAFATARQFETMIRNVPGLAVTRLNNTDFDGSHSRAGIFQNYLNFADDGKDILSHIHMTNDSLRIGDKSVVCHTLCELEQLTTEISPSKVVRELSTENSAVHLSWFSPLSIDLSCEHIVNQVIYKMPQGEALSKLDLKRRRMVSMARNTDNDVYAQELDEFTREVAKEQRSVIGYHLNVFSAGTASDIELVKDNVATAMSKSGVTPVYNNRNAQELFWCMLPGNEAGMSTREYMTLGLEAALCTWLYDGYDIGVSGGNMKLSERQKLVPVTFDIQEVAKKQNLIENYNACVLGPSGSGKSFFMNKYVHSCYANGQHVFLVDAGHSYRAQCSIIHEISEGKDGSYYTYENGKAISFNPFRDVKRFSDDDVSINFLYSLMCTLWKNGTETISNTALRYVKESVDQFILSWKEENDPTFDDYFKFLKSSFSSFLKEEDVDIEYFDFKGYLMALKQFTSGKKYGRLLNSTEQINILHDRFVVFEIDDIKDDPIVYPITTLVILDMFTEKMRRLSEFKALVIEEAWKALQGEQMTEFMLELWKTARKKNTSAVVVSQELEDLTSSDIMKDTIISNSAVKILLDQSKYLNSFDTLAKTMSLSSEDKALIFSLNKTNPDISKGREVFFNLGNRRSFVLKVEVSPEERYAYSSDPDDKIKLAAEYAKTGSYVQSIQNLIRKPTYE